MTGNPVFRFQFIHATAGTFIITEPIGWIDTKLVLERDGQFHSLIERFEGAFTFYGNNGQVNGGIDVIRTIERDYGVDADLTVDIDISFDDGESFEDIYLGLYDFSENEENNLNQIRSAIIRNDFWVKFINRQDTPVNIQSATGLDGGSVDVIDPLNIVLTGQIIDKSTTYIGDIFASDPAAPEFVMPIGPIDDSGTFEEFDVFTQGTLDLESEEISNSFDPLIEFLTLQTDLSPNIELESEGGQIQIFLEAAESQIVFHGTIVADSAEVDPSSITSISVSAQFLIQKNADTQILLAGDNDVLPGPSTPSPGLPVTFTRVFDLSTASGYYTMDTVPGDIIKVFVKWNIAFSIDVGADAGVINWSERDITIQRFSPRVRFVLASTYKNTNAQTFFIHDVGRSIIDRITNQNNSLTSPHLGNEMTSPPYGSAGCGSTYINAKGLQIRNYTLEEKPFALSFKDWWGGVNPILNLGLGYTSNENGIEIERQQDFYDPTISVYFDYVNDIIRRYDNDVIFNKVDVGYTKWQSENISGIDDAQTKHSYATRFKKVGKAIQLMSGFIAASLAIETTRRSTKEKSADYKYDDETFIIAVTDIESTPAQVQPETNQHFSYITGLRHADTRYNSRITPARNLLRWLRYLNGCLQSYVGSVYKFVSGEGNFDMDSDLESGDCDEFQEAISEKQDIPVLDHYLHLPELFEITLPMYWEEYKAIRSAPKQAIGISQSGTGHVAFFIKILEYDICKSRARIEAWPRTPFQITQTDYIPRNPCAPPECGVTSRQTEDGDFRLTEDGQCREIE